MAQHVNVGFEAVNARGVVLATFGDLALATAWARRNAAKHGGVDVERVERSERRRTVFSADGRPRLTLAQQGAV